MKKGKKNNNKKDLVTEREFNKLSKPIKKHHIPAHGQLPHDDENKFKMEETLLGMEYDLEPELAEELKKDWNDEEDSELLDRI